MSNQGFVNFNVLERIVSRDLNNLQSLSAKTLADILRYQLSAFGVARDVVFGGLNVTSGGVNTFNIAAGALAQFSTGLPPVPTAFDSPYRIGIQETTTPFVFAPPVSGSWAILEARCVQVLVSTQSRDIKNVGTGLFVPTNVPKQYATQLEYQVLYGNATTLPTRSASGWVPLATFFAAGGAGGVPTSIGLYRPMWNDAVQITPVKGEYSVQAFLSGSVDDNVRIRTLAPTWLNATKLWYSYNYANPSGPIDGPTIKPAGVTLNADTWYYLYIAAVQGLNPLSGNSDRGILVLSDVGPNDNGAFGTRFNTSAMDLPEPYNTAQCPVGDAVCIGAVRRNSANNGWLHQGYEGGGVYYVDPIAVFNGVPATPGPGAVFQATTVPEPNTALGVELEVSANTTAGGGVAFDIGQNAGAYDSVPSVRIGTVILGGTGGSIMYGKGWYPPATFGNTIAIRGINSTADPILSLGVRLTRYSW